MYRFLICLLIAGQLQSAIVDRIAITVNRQVITEAQIDEELRVTAFLNHVPVPGDLSARRSAADRLVAQLLVGHEMQLSHYPEPDPADVDRYVAEIRSSFSGNAVYEQALRDYQITDAILKQHLADQLATLGFIELRFRPNLEVPDSEVQSFYQREMATWKTEHPGVAAPSLNSARPAILKTLTEQHTDQILDTWLGEARKQVSIIYLDKTLQ